MMADLDAHLVQSLMQVKTKNYSFTLHIVTAVFCCVGALAITGSLHHIDKDLLGWWLCEWQDNKTGGLNGRPEKLPDDIENGGISDRPDDAVDVYHTYFGVAGLSLLEYPGLKAIDPAYALLVDVKIGRFDD
ncbi:hypothetical protein ACE6H2_011825 [Prunus campanulata]